jgi:hypothetical protein
LRLIIISFLQGGLSWDQLNGDVSVKQRRKDIRKMQEDTTLVELYKGYRGLKYDETPDYNYLKRLFKEKTDYDGYQYNHIFSSKMPAFSKESR